MANAGPLRELVDIATSIYHRAAREFRERNHVTPWTPTNPGDRGQYAHELSLAIAEAQEARVVDTVTFSEWNAHLGLLQGAAWRNLDCKAHWRNHVHSEIRQGRASDDINHDAASWFAEIQRELRDEIRWFSNLDLQRAARTEAESSAADDSKQRDNEPTAKPRKHKNVNARMLQTVQRNADSAGWTARQWASHLGCSKSSVTATETWRTFSNHRELDRASRRAERARR